MLRIFVATNQLSALFMALYAKRTARSSYIDILIIEPPDIKKSLSDVMHETKLIHPWSEIYDFGKPVADNTDTKPSFRKSVTRNIKNIVLVKQVYSLLHRFYIRKLNKQRKTHLAELLSKHLQNKSVELNHLSISLLLEPLLQIFPTAKVRHFEHGLGDYFNVQPLLKAREYNCVFDKSFKRYLIKSKKGADAVFSALLEGEFENAANVLVSDFSQKQNISSLLKSEPCVLILMEAVHMYNVDVSFWELYVQKCVEQLSDPKKYFYLLKPHPLQSEESIQKTKHFFEKNNLRYELLSHPAFANRSIETMFPLWKNNVEHVFALFSSGLFYLSVLFPLPHITYHYSYRFMEKHIRYAPEQYKKHFLGLKELIEEVFAERCKEFDCETSQK